MHDLFAIVRDNRVQGVEVLLLSEWAERRYAGPAAAVRADARRKLDDEGVPAQHPLRAETFEMIDRQFAAVRKETLEVIEGALARGVSLEDLGRVMGVELVRAPRFELGEPSLQTFAEVLGLRIVKALASECMRKCLGRDEAAEVLKAAVAPIVEAVREATEHEKERRDARAVY